MRIVLIVDVALFVAGIIAAIVFFTGVELAAAFAFACGGLGLGLAIMIGITQSGNWGVPGDEPRLSFRRAQ